MFHFLSAHNEDPAPTETEAFTPEQSKTPDSTVCCDSCSSTTSGIRARGGGDPPVSDQTQHHGALAKP